MLFFDLPFNTFFVCSSGRARVRQTVQRTNDGQLSPLGALDKAEVKRVPFVDINVSISEKTAHKTGLMWSLRQTVVSQPQMSKCDRAFRIFPPSFRANPRSACGASPGRVEPTAILTGGEHLWRERVSPRGPRGFHGVRGRPPTSCLLGHKGQGSVM